jgi:hypothetical protein
MGFFLFGFSFFSQFWGANFMIYHIIFSRISKETFEKTQHEVLCHAQNYNLAKLTAERTYKSKNYVMTDINVVMCLNTDNEHLGKKELSQQAYRPWWGLFIIGEDNAENMRPLRHKR